MTVCPHQERREVVAKLKGKGSAPFFRTVSRLYSITFGVLNSTSEGTSTAKLQTRSCIQVQTGNRWHTEKERQFQEGTNYKSMTGLRQPTSELQRSCKPQQPWRAAGKGRQLLGLRIVSCEREATYRSSGLWQRDATTAKPEPRSDWEINAPVLSPPGFCFCQCFSLAEPTWKPEDQGTKCVIHKGQLAVAKRSGEERRVSLQGQSGGREAGKHPK